MPTRSVWTTFFAIAALLATGVKAAEPVGPLLDIWAADTLDNREPAIALADEHESFLVVWRTAQDSYTWDIWARRVDFDGTMSPVVCVATQAGELLQSPAVAYEPGTDKYLVAFVQGIPASGSDIWARFVDWDGALAGAPFLVEASTDLQASPAVAANPAAGELLVVYESGPAGGDTQEVLARRVRASDGLVYEPVTVASVVGEHRWGPDVAYDEVHDRYDIVYLAGSMAGIQIRARTASSTLGSLSPELEVWSQQAAGALADRPRIAVRGPEALIAFELSGGATQIRGRLLDANGYPTGAPEGFPLLPPDGGAGNDPHYLGDVALTATGYVTVAHRNENLGAEVDIHASLFVPGELAARAPALIVDGRAGAYSWKPVVACSASGICLVAFVDLSSDVGADLEIRGRLVSFSIFADGFESGGVGAWSAAVP